MIFFQPLSLKTPHSDNGMICTSLSIRVFLDHSFILSRLQSLGNFILLALLECRGGLQPAIDWLASAAGVPSTARILPACSALSKSLLGTPAAARQCQPSIVKTGDEGSKTEREMAGVHGSTIEEALVRQRGGSADEERGNVEGPIIQAVLENGDVITGQNMISHPPIYPRYPTMSFIFPMPLSSFVMLGPTCHDIYELSAACAFNRIASAVDRVLLTSINEVSLSLDCVPDHWYCPVIWSWGV
jgi:hypothetical protein